MTDSERALWQWIQRRANADQPDYQTAILRAFARIRDELTETQLSALVHSGQLDELLNALIDDAMDPVRSLMRDTVADAMQAFGAQLPVDARPAKGTITFDILNPKIVEAIATMEGQVLGRFVGDVQDAVRTTIENGLRDGMNPRDIAIGLRDVVGLSQNQLDAVANFRTMLENGDREALTRALRDQRFDATLNRALGANGTGLTAPQVDKMAAAYAKGMVNFNAETQARTATLQALKEGQRLTRQDAIGRGVLDGANEMKRWAGVMDDRERDEHVAMEGEEQPIDTEYSNGEMTPGESTYNCRCISIFFTADAPGADAGDAIS